jgi:hypothetical protein
VNASADATHDRFADIFLTPSQLLGVEVLRRPLEFTLYSPSEMEVPQHCVTSVCEIRHFLTGEISRLGEDSDLNRSLRAMRAACRKFIDVIGLDGDIVRFGSHPGHWASWEFNGALGELRGIVGLHVARIATEYGLDVEDDLAQILPGPDDSDD